jgi:HEAT repeat protein
MDQRLPVNGSAASEDASFESALDALAKDGPLSGGQLAALAHLEPSEVARLSGAWAGLTADRRRELVAQLAAAERSTPRHDFSAIYAFAIEDPDPAVRRLVADSLGGEATPSLPEALLALATGDPDPSVREAAVRAVGPFALKAELGELAAESRGAIEETLFRVLHRADEMAATRGEALAGLGYLDGDRVDGEIRRAFDDPSLRVDAVRAMGRTANPVWLATLAREAASADPDLRREAARACGEIGDQRATAVVADMVEDPVADVRLAAIAALGQIGGDEARDALVYAFEDKRESVREAAQAALAQLEFDEDPLGL